MSRRARILLAAGAAGAIVLVAVGAALWLLARPLRDLQPPPADPLRPDLVSEIADVQAATGVKTGRQFLYFTTTIANVGDGPLALHADRRNRFTSSWRVSQQFDERDGTRSEREIPGDLVWGGHGHDHWHLKFGAAYRLEDADGVERTLQKAGYCFFDQVARTPAAGAQVFDKDTCDGLDRTSLEMGMSVGWSDPYQWTLPDQNLDVTGLPDGRYRLYATADPDGWIDETDEGNNVDWVDVELVTSTEPARARVVAQAPSRLPPPPQG